MYKSVKVTWLGYMYRPGWKVVGEVKKVGKSRNFQPKVGKSRNFSVFKVGKLRNVFYNFFSITTCQLIVKYSPLNCQNCLQLSIAIYKINFTDVLLNMASIYCWVINHFPSRTFNKLLSFWSMTSEIFRNWNLTKLNWNIFISWILLSSINNPPLLAIHKTSILQFGHP